eukprot:2547575-Pyramimonas_sp.AAC.1
MQVHVGRPPSARGGGLRSPRAGAEGGRTEGQGQWQRPATGGNRPCTAEAESEHVASIGERRRGCLGRRRNVARRGCVARVGDGRPCSRPGGEGGGVSPSPSCVARVGEG